MCTKSMKLKQNGTGAMTAAKNEAFIGLYITWKLLFGRGDWLGGVYWGELF